MWFNHGQQISKTFPLFQEVTLPIRQYFPIFSSSFALVNSDAIYIAINLPIQSLFIYLFIYLFLVTKSYFNWEISHIKNYCNDF